MHDFITVFAYLIIATIAFAVPVIVSILSLFSEGILRVKRQTDEQIKQLKKILLEQMEREEATETKFIKESTKSLKKLERHSQKRLRILNPKTQLLGIVIFLFISLILLCSDMVLRDNKWNYTNHTLSIYLIIGSLILFGIAMIKLKQVTWLIMTIKLEQEEERKYEVVKPSTIITGEQQD